jgi:predicted Zn-dependent protease
LVQATSCQQRVVAVRPADFQERRTLAAMLSQGQRYDEAIQHLDWCLRRQPQAAGLQQDLATAKERLSRSPPIARQPRGNEVF